MKSSNPNNILSSITPRFYPLLAGAMLLLTGAVGASAQPLLTGDFESGSITSPWSVVPGNAGTVGIVDDSSPFGSGEKSVFLNTTTASFDSKWLKGEFSESTTSALSIQFDFMVSSAGAIPTMYLEDATGLQGIYLNLNRSGNLTNQTSGSAWDVIAPIALGTWYNVNITTSEAGNGVNTYTLSILAYGQSTPIYSEELTFRNSLSEYSQLRFRNAGNTASVDQPSAFYIDNVVVTPIPEATTYAMFLGAFGLVVTFMRRIRFARRSIS